MDHLLGTCALLRAWGSDASVCKAGLFHSIYGTNAFGRPCVEMEDRRSVIEMIGEEAEWLAYLFCVSHRPRAFLEAIENPVLQNRYDDKYIEISESILNNLIEIECANLIDQGAGLGFFRTVKRLKDNGLLSLRENIFSDILQFVDIQDSRLVEKA
jgi:hypothetical protein